MSTRSRLSPEILAVLGLSALLAVFATLAVATDSQRESSSGQSSHRSTYHTGPDGLKAVFLTLQAAGFPVARHRHAWTSLPPQATVVLAFPSAFEPAPEEWERMLEWVRDGGLLVYSRRSAPSRQAGEQTWLPLSALVSTGPGYEAPVISVHEHRATLPPSPPLPSSLRLPEEGWPLYGDDTRTAVTWHAIGKGTCVELASPEILSNDGIARRSNLRFVLNLLAQRGWHGEPSRAGSGAILFDEYHNGYGNRETRSLWSALPSSVHAGLLQILAAALLLMWVRSRRLAAARELPPPPRERSEYLESMAGLLERAGARRLVARTLRRQLLEGLAKAAGMPAESLDPATLLAERDNPLHQRARAVVAHCDVWEAGTRPSSAELLRTAREIRRILQAARDGIPPPP